MDETADYSLEIQIATQFLDDESIPEQDRYVFAYTIRITNTGSVAAQLVAEGQIREARAREILEERGAKGEERRA